MEKKNFNKGITLVALVITIIVLLILAGVAINMAINSDGLFGKANDAVTKWDIAVQEESDTIWNLLNVGQDKPEELSKGDVKLSYTISNTNNKEQINLKIDIIDVPVVDDSLEVCNNFLKNEFLQGSTINELLVLIGEEFSPGGGLTSEQVYEYLFMDSFGFDKTYAEFMANPDEIIEEETGYKTAEAFFKILLLDVSGDMLLQSIVHTEYSKLLLPELLEKEEAEIEDIIEGYYNNEKNIEEIFSEMFDGLTVDEMIVYINGERWKTEQGEYIIGKKDILILIAGQLYIEKNPIVVTKPDNSTENIAWFGMNSETITYPITEAGDYTFKILSPSGKIQEATVKVGLITLDKQDITVTTESGQEVTETLTATLVNLDESKILWTTSNENIAQIEGTGTTVNIIVKSAGAATITAICEGHSATCTILNPVVAYITEGTRKAPVPVGYVASQIPTEDTISEGLVIYQGTDPVTGEVNSTEHTTAMTTRNQFVWIPVDDINYMVMCKSNASGSVCDLELIDGVLQCTNPAHKSTKTDLCGRVYDITDSTTTVDGKIIHTSSQTFNETEWTKQKWDTSSYREPDIVSSIDKDEYMSSAGISSGKVADFQLQLTTDFTAMATSVAKYGGFYVSRYETGQYGASLKNQKVLVEGNSSAGIVGSNWTTVVYSNMWYGMYSTLRYSRAIDKTAVCSHMIWGSQYDMIIKYLGENSNNEPQIAHITRQLAKQKLTGETTTDIMSNIYDLEGNNIESTVQAKGTNNRIGRGGVFSRVADGNLYYPSNTIFMSAPYTKNCTSTSRSVLYLK